MASSSLKTRGQFNLIKIKFAPFALLLICVAFAIASYLQAINYPFIFDDNSYITSNHNLEGLHLSELWRLFFKPYNIFSEFLPLRELSYWFDMSVFGLNPSAFRLHNIFLYLLCLPFVYAATLKLWQYFRSDEESSAPWAAAVVTALFALHPSHAEAVVWIAGRKDVLSTLFSLLALWFAMRVRQEQGFRVSQAAIALFALVAAMLSKASAVAVAPVIALLWVMYWRDMSLLNRRNSLLMWPFASLLLALLIAVIFSATSTQRIPFYFGIETVTRALAVLGWLARLAVSPESRHFFYPVFEDPFFPVMVAVGVVVLVFATAGAVMIIRKRSLEAFALVAFLLLCLPSMQLIPYSPPSLVSDRWLALAVWPAILLIVALSWRLKPVPRIFLLLAIALPWSFQTFERPRDWRSFETLIDKDLRAYPGYFVPAAYKIGFAQLPRGLYRDAAETANGIADPEMRNVMIGLVDTEYAVHVSADSTGDPKEAMALLWKFGLDFKKPPVQAKWNLPINNLYRHNLGLLVAEWDYLAKRFPDNVSVHYNAGLSLLNVSRYEEAAAYLRAATESQSLQESARGTAYKNLGLALLYGGHNTEAEVQLRAALAQFPPDLRAHCLLAEIYKQTKQIEKSALSEARCPK